MTAVRDRHAPRAHGLVHSEHIFRKNTMSHPKRFSRLAAGAALALLGVVPVVAQACDTEPYLGNVCTYAFDWCPRGYVKADGRLLNIREFNGLYSLLATKFGGDGQTTFGIPDLRGRSVVGAGVSAQATYITAVNFAQQLGQQTLMLNSTQVPLPVHTHTATLTPVAGPLVVPATANQLNVSIKLPAGTSTAGAVATPPSGTGVNAYMTAMSAKSGPATISLVGPYTGGVAPDAPNSKLPLTVKVDGTAPTVATSASVQVMTDAKVVIAQAAGNALQAISTQSAGMGSTMCIAVVGVYPNRP
ncbi:phage tail protein [uncultured Massilia sp.]|uniref:phage tail protein n=1 Tax=uncultured Massilia sp. TaxID=169973 RepID=UPI0025F3D49C|nr:tail fiber protein [uncultured Massilia sp.]